MVTPVTASEKLIVTVPACVLRGSGVTSQTSAVGAVVSTTHWSLASSASAFPVRSWIPEVAAVSVSTYVPSAAVTPDRSIVYVAPLPPTVNALISTPAPSRVSAKSPMLTPVTGSEKLMVTVPACVLRGSGVTSAMSAVGAVVSMTHVSLASTDSAFPAASWIPEPKAVNVNTYVPATPVTLDRSSVYAAPLPPTVNALISTVAPSRVSPKSAMSIPVIDSVKLIVTVPALVLRGSGVTSAMSAAGDVVSTTHASLASANRRFPAASWIPEPEAVSVSTYIPSAPVTPDRSSVYVAPLPPTVRPLRSTVAPSRVRAKSAMSTPVTASEKLIVTVPACVLRGSGVTSAMSAVGGVTS